jgi:16S rRNA (uracil1498-N3)-methyltransferase
MPRFFCPQPLFPSTMLALPEIIVRHIQVLRLSEGDRLTLFNGEGGEFEATLTGIEKKRASALIGAFSPREAELPFAITLAQALPEASKMDWIIEKAVELGVTAFQPLAVQRSVVKLSTERAEKRHAHWQGIIAAASEQCGRNRLAALEPLMDFNRWIAQTATQPRILFSPRATLSLSGWARDQKRQAVALMIGPEGGFTEQEEQLAVTRGAQLLSLGERVLRTETAGIAAVAALSALWG